MPEIDQSNTRQFQTEEKKRIYCVQICKLTLAPFSQSRILVFTISYNISIEEYLLNEAKCKYMPTRELPSRTYYASSQLALSAVMTGLKSEVL